MTNYTFTITIPASGAPPVSVSAAAVAAGAVLAGASALFNASYLPATKLFFQMAPAAAGGLGFVGASNVTFAGANADYELGAGATGTPGGTATVESESDSNDIELEQYYVHGAHAGDVVLVSYHQR